jgi:hypothetical protein
MSNMGVRGCGRYRSRLAGLAVDEPVDSLGLCVAVLGMLDACVFGLLGAGVASFGLLDAGVVVFGLLGVKCTGCQAGCAALLACHLDGSESSLLAI